ncbi:MAG: hypothetical protein KatS3mg031_1846 [Chitinophagales bacterium]|nr:MAG: hypothetical protein KatS3mg031_1846 [Chitinophagales bacterium]
MGLLFLVGCNSYQKVLKNPDPAYKLDKAKEFYEKGAYDKALPILEEMIPVYKGTKSIDDLYYMYADCHFHQSDFLLAAFHFKNIYDSYPNSKHAEESLYMYAYCNYMLSPDVSLDQTYTEKALEAFQLFINVYPNSARVGECNKLMDVLRQKLESKAFRAGMLYYRMGKYRAAALTFTNLLKEYPDTRYAEEASFLIIKSYYLYAENSIPSKQLERYELALEAYKDFSILFKSSKWMKEALQLKESCNANIEKIKNKIKT